MPLTELLPVVTQLSHDDKLRLIQILLLAVAEEDGCDLQVIEPSNKEALLLEKLASTEAVVWSPSDEHGAAQTLSDMLVASKMESDAER
ncbi:MAG: hypothetical protein ABG776_10190 [Cyanobacteria bacterium J06555_13]